MIVRLARHVAGAREAKGHVVIVDVFRAFTTAAFCVAAGAREIVLLGDHEAALAMKRDDPELFLTGEIGGRPIAGFDIGNSPSAIERLDLAGKRVVQRTSSGTQGVVAALGAREIVLGSLVIASATARYLGTRARDVTVVAMGGSDGDPAEEDELGAEFIASRLRAEPPPPIAMPAWVGDLDRSGRAWEDWFPRRDAELAMELDRFSFALPVRREDGLFVARPEFV